MEENDTHTEEGIASIIFGLFGIVLYFVGIFFYSFIGNRLYGMVFGVIFGVIALVLGYIAKKREDSYGTYGIYLGIFIIIFAIITILLTTVTSVETGVY